VDGLAYLLDMRLRFRGVGAAVVLIAFVAVGCGGGSENTSKSGAQAPSSTGATSPSSPGSSSPGSSAPGTSGPGAPAPSGKRSKTSGPPFSKQSAALAQAKCAQRRPALARALQKLARASLTLRPGTTADTARAVNQVIAVTRAQMNDVKALQVPAGDRPQVQKLLRSYADQLSILGRMRTALQHRSLGQMEELLRQSYAQRVSNEALAGSLGAGACGLTVY
jgi:hypothetical protein